jgi:hypothetical protein
MADLTPIEKRRLEIYLAMSSGYVLNFTNKTFAEFILDSTGLDIYDPKYDYGSNSKANRMRRFWVVESNGIVGKLLGDIFEAWDLLASDGSSAQPPADCLKIVHRLKNSSSVPDIGVVVPISDDHGFEALARSVRQSIERNEPDVGLDRLHTFLVKYFRALCKRHGLSPEREKPLHSLTGEYIKILRHKGLIESEMTDRILKSTISIMESFNKVRNDQSFAHDNKILNHSESLLIFCHVTSLIRFIEAVDKK